MKNNILILIFMLSSAMASAQTIHWIVFADTNDQFNGSEVESSLAMLNAKFIDRVDDAMQGKGYFSKRYTYAGSRFKETNCNHLLANFDCDINDIVIFYYLGHGARALVTKEQFKSYSQQHPWPDLSFENGNSQKEYISLSTVHNQLKNKNARLTVTIGMCCNLERSSHRRHSGAKMGAQAKKYKIVSKSFAKRIQKWLLSNKGDVIVSASSPGEAANGGFEYDSAEVDCFTGALCEIFDQYARSESSETITWTNFLQKVSQKCKANASSLDEKANQNVKFKTNLY